MKKLILLCSFALLSFSCDKKAEEKATDKEACETDSKVNKDGITSLGATGIVEIDNQLKIIFGKNAKELKKCIDQML